MTQPKTYERTLFQSPIDKFLKERKIPIKFLVDVFSVILIIAYVFLSIHKRRPFITNSQDGFLLRFLPKEFFEEDTKRRVGLSDTTDGKHIFLMITKNEAIDWMKTVSDRYFSIKQDSTETFDYPYGVAEIQMNIKYSKNSFREFIAHNPSTYSLSQSSQSIHYDILSTRRNIESSHAQHRAQTSKNPWVWNHKSSNELNLPGITDAEPLNRTKYTDDLMRIKEKYHSSLEPHYKSHAKVISHSESVSKFTDPPNLVKQERTVDSSTRNNGEIAKKEHAPIHFLGEVYTSTQILTPENPYGFLQFSDTSFFKSGRIFFDHLQLLKLRFSIVNADPSHTNPKCHKWTVDITLDARYRGGIVPMIIKIYHSDYVDLRSYIFNQLIYDPIIVMEIVLGFISFVSLVLYGKQIMSRLKKYLKRKKLYGDRNVMDLFSVYLTKWHIIIILKDLLNTIGYFLCLLSPFIFQSSTIDFVWSFAIGVGGLLSLVSVVRYLKFGNPYFYITIRSLENGMPPLFRAVFGSLPVFFGFALCGNVWFGSYSRYFKTIDEACVTLFSVMNGDVVIDTFGMIYAQSIWTRIAGRIYLYFFVTLIITGVFNLMLMILQNAYFVIKDSLDERYKGEKPNESDPDSCSDDEYSEISIMSEERHAKEVEEQLMTQQARNLKEQQSKESSSKSQNQTISESIYHMLSDKERNLLDLLSQRCTPSETQSFYDIYADSICDAIENKLSLRHHSECVKQEIEVLNYLRLWIKAILSQDMDKSTIASNINYAPAAVPSSNLHSNRIEREIRASSQSTLPSQTSELANIDSNASQVELSQKGWDDDFEDELTVEYPNRRKDQNLLNMDEE